MFIRGVNARAGTGYTGDVNAAFRQGRQDAYRDYVDNFNFATQADAYNNAENQRNVQRIADNYATSLRMDSNARQAALNFVNQNDQLDQATFNADVNFQTRDALAPRQAQMADNQARTVYFSGEQAANNAQHGALTAANNVENVPLENQSRQAGLQAQAANANLQATTAAGKQDAYNYAQQQLRDFNSPENTQRLQNEFLDKSIGMLRQNGVQGTDEELRTRLMADPQFLDQFNQYRQEQFNQATTPAYVMSGDINNAAQTVAGAVTPPRGARAAQQVNKPVTIKGSATKMLKADVVRPLISGSTNLGNGVYYTPTGEVLHVNSDGSANSISYRSSDGRVPTLDEIRAFLGANNQASVNTQLDNELR